MTVDELKGHVDRILDEQEKARKAELRVTEERIAGLGTRLRNLETGILGIVVTLLLASVGALIAVTKVLR